MPTGRSISPRDGEGMGPRGWGPGWEARWDLPAQFFRRRLKNLWNRPCLIESNSEKLSMLSPDLGPANCRSAPSKIHRGRVGHGGVAVESPPPESAWREQGVAIDRRSVPRWTRNPTPRRSPRSSGGPHSSAARRLCSTASDAAVSIMVNRNARTAGLGVPARAFPDASPRGD
jgi:hypothetical protein